MQISTQGFSAVMQLCCGFVAAAGFLQAKKPFWDCDDHPRYTFFRYAFGGKKKNPESNNASWKPTSP